MHKKFLGILEQLNSIVLDKTLESKLAITCLLAQGHLLIEDVPGVGKTTLVRALGQLCGLTTHRLQFTIDLLPADIIGASVFDQHTQSFTFKPGPLFAQMVMADELNRASPRTQSALLQAMEENQVSVDGKTMSLPHPFFVIATQNPQQQVGTFPLPESQLDRFMMSLELNFASESVEKKLIQQGDPKARISTLNSVVNLNDFLAAFKLIDAIQVPEVVAQYVSALLTRSRVGFSGIAHGSLPLSTRAGMLLVRSAKAWAFLNGRDFITPEDIQSVFISVVGHRLGGTNGVRKGRQWAKDLQAETAVPA